MEFQLSLVLVEELKPSQSFKQNLFKASVVKNINISQLQWF